MHNPATIFQERIKKFSAEYKSLNARYNFIATIRVLIFLAFLILFVVFANYKLPLELGITVILFPFVFGLIVKAHQRIKFRREHAKLLQSINESELHILNGNLKSQDTGSEYLNNKHPYANDLDIFGSNSVFQLLNRTSTKGGKDLLASWLLNKSDKQTVLDRQTAIEELSEKIDWRQHFQANGLHYEMQQDNSNELLSWIKSSNGLSNVYKMVAFVVPVITITSILLTIFTDWPWFATALIGLANGIILNRFQARVKDLTDSVAQHIGVLGAYSLLIKQVENSAFQSAKLHVIKGSIDHGDDKASQSINALYKILDQLNARSNFFYMIIDLVLLYDLHIIMRSEKWKAKNQADVANWFDSISELEALCSLAGFRFAKPHFVWPTIADKDFFIEAKELGHPLIASDERITNNYELKEKGSVSIITGSNMSGKSTFLRTLGVNLVLAQMGSVVCAKELAFSFVQVFTSMRTQDNLEEHVSSFYAELQRIQMLLQLVSKPTPVLYMLDEILKGTNSQDRHIGAKSLALQLSKTNSFGLISTHDLALGEMAVKHKNISNYSFNSIIENDEIIFPYKLEKGICHSFNASKLMEKIGIEIHPDH
ncbi:MAG: hypothetical protein RLO81_04090 [Fulvivirga sp.]|uniref:MutS-related protein n=1 Tax=Fulvivirga sp. TaxID=1931237 RepID=UPI0032F05870